MHDSGMRTSTMMWIVVVSVIVIVGVYLLIQPMNTAVQPVTQQTNNQIAVPIPTSSQPATQPTPASNPAPNTTPPHESVSIVNFAFSPTTITIKAGTTVTWTNNDSTPHTVTSDIGSFTSQTLQTQGSFSHTFNVVGTYSYHCRIHPSMHGTVVVTQ